MSRVEHAALAMITVRTHTFDDYPLCELSTLAWEKELDQSNDTISVRSVNFLYKTLMTYGMVKQVIALALTMAGVEYDPLELLTLIRSVSIR